MPIEAQRVTFYRQVAIARTEAELDQVRVELKDRYGELPLPAEVLLRTNRLRIACQATGVAGAKRSGEKVRLTLTQPRASEHSPALRAAAAGLAITNVVADGVDQILVVLKPGLAPEDALLVLRDMLLAYANSGKVATP
jgi:transcription-repair coupling factor (superfamily II helicase)